LENAKELVEKFEKEYGKKERKIRRQENYKESNEYWREIFPGRFTARNLYGWDDKRYNREYWNRIKKNWQKWKGMKPLKKRKLEMIEEEGEYQRGKIEE